MNCWNRVAQTMATSGKPVLYADYQFAGSGGFLVYAAAFLRAGAANVGFVASSRLRDLVEAVKCFAAAKKAGPSFNFAAAVAATRTASTPKAANLPLTPDPLAVLSPEETLRRMKAAKILAVRGATAEPATTAMGIAVAFLPFAELNEAWAAADKAEAEAVAKLVSQHQLVVRRGTQSRIELAVFFIDRFVREKRGMRRHPTPVKASRMMSTCPPVTDDPIHIRRINIDEIAITGVDASIFQHLGNIVQNMRIGIKIVRIENTDHITGRQINSFVHGIVNPVIRFGNKFVDQAGIEKSNR